MKHFSHMERALLQKDFGEVWSQKTVRFLLTVVPFSFSVVLPIIYLLIAYNSKMEHNEIKSLLVLLPENQPLFNAHQTIFYIVSHYIAPMLFLLITVISASLTAATCFVGEKERGTFETLLLTPMPVKQILKVKMLECFFLSLLTTALSFLALTIVLSIGDILLELPFFLNLEWVITAFLFSPLLSILAILSTLLAGRNEKKYMEAFKTSSSLLFPLILLYVLQFTGFYRLNALLLIFLSVLVAAVDFVLLVTSPPRISLDKILSY